MATIEFESGDKIDFKHNFTLFKPTVTHEGEAEQVAFAVAATAGSYGISIISVIDDGPGTYSYDENFDEDGNKEGALIQFSNYEENNVETFVPFYLPEKTMGKTKLTITSLTKDHVKATFSATLYNINTGEKVIIKDGKLNSKINRKEIDEAIGETEII